MRCILVLQAFLLAGFVRVRAQGEKPPEGWKEVTTKKSAVFVVLMPADGEIKEKNELSERKNRQ